MIQTIFQADQAVTLIGAGRVDALVLQASLALAPYVVAADGGAAAALAAGVMPKAVIGDFDSLTPHVKAQIPADRLFPVNEQDSTDFDKALRSIAAPLVIAVGFDGDRLDHMLASFNSLLRWPARKCVMLTPDQVVFLCPPRISLPLKAGSLVSLFPLGAVRGRSEGLEWPIDGLEFAPDGRIGTSNRAVGRVDLWMEAPAMLVILPRAALEAVVQALQDADAWPALDR